MHTVIHYFRIIARILSSQYRYSRLKLLVSYTGLTCQSVLWHKLRRRYANDGNVIHKAKLFNFAVRFGSYPHLLTLVEEIFVYGVYQFNASSETPLIIDGGSNIGLSVLYFKTLYPKARVIAFEPEQNACALLRENCVLNNLRDVAIYNEALTDKEGEMNLYRQPLPGAFMTRLASPGDVAELVKASRLTEYIHGIVDLLKIDVEGSETVILDDLIGSEKINNIRQMIIEFHPGKMTGQYQDYLIKLKALGFTMREVITGYNLAETDRIFAFNKE